MTGSAQLTMAGSINEKADLEGRNEATPLSGEALQPVWALLEQHTMKTQSMRGSPYFKAFQGNNTLFPKNMK